MLENINILRIYDETQKNNGSLSLFLGNMRTMLFDLKDNDRITLDDRFKLCEWSWVLDDIYKKYNNHGIEYLLMQCFGYVHICELKDIKIGED